MASYFTSRLYFHEPKASENTAYEWNDSPYSTIDECNKWFILYIDILAVFFDERATR